MRDKIKQRFLVTGMDCPSCASKIEKVARSLDGVEDVKVSVSSQILTLTSNDADLPALEAAINKLGYQLNILGSDTGDNPISSIHTTSAYKRALWIVVLLNLGYGIIEMVGGFLSDSQALKADALDFLGDGLITLVGLVAISWTLLWRARTAFVQGIFLGLLGLGVLLATIYRVFVLQQPEAELMGMYGGIALCVNVAAALVLIPHRAGDSNVRAVWLFSRNDAIGNAAVVFAAGLVGYTNTPWPDLVVAIIIAGLFLHSSLIILKDASADLRQTV
jgi:Co/Zn/Cd efflux system component/copper chaperone CopZ